MTDPTKFIGERAARQLSNTTKTPPQWRGASPRWLTQLLPWVPVEAGVFRVNQALDDKFNVRCTPDPNDALPVGFSDYEAQPREYVLSSVTTTVAVHTRVSDLFRSPMDQVKEQLTLAVDKLKEKQEDELITKVWKEPSFFLAHPKTIAAFGRECTRRGVPPPTATLFGSPFLTWRGLPLIPCDKIRVHENKSDILLVRTGERKRGVVGLFQPGLPGEVSPSLSVRLMGINPQGAAQYLLALYCSTAVLVHDALAVLEGVKLDHYYDYP